MFPVISVWTLRATCARAVLAGETATARYESKETTLMQDEELVDP